MQYNIRQDAKNRLPAGKAIVYLICFLLAVTLVALYLYYSKRDTFIAIIFLGLLIAEVIWVLILLPLIAKVKKIHLFFIIFLSVIVFLVILGILLLISFANYNP